MLPTQIDDCLHGIDLEIDQLERESPRFYGSELAGRLQGLQNRLDKVRKEAAGAVSPADEGMAFGPATARVAKLAGEGANGAVMGVRGWEAQGKGVQPDPHSISAFA